jgi:DNA topoisomerase-3
VGKSLVITEKPSVARDIVSVMGQFHEHEGYWESDRYVVTYAVGHLVELMEPEDIDPAYKRWTLDQLPILPKEFRLKPKARTSERVRTIRKLIGRKDVSRSWSFSRAKSRSSASGCNR